MKIGNLVAGSLVCIGMMWTVSLPAKDTAKQGSLMNDPHPGNSRLIDYASKLIKEKLKQSKFEGGLSVSLVSGAGVIWTEGFGWESQSHKRPATADTAMLMGSVSKTFTAIAVMQLVEQGKINLDKPYTDYVPSLKIKSHKPSWPKFTVRQMLHHSSGLPGDYGKGFYVDAPTSAKPVDYRAVPELLNQTYLAYSPDSVQGYSNLAFSLLGILVEKVSDEYFPDYVEKHILDPLGMTHASFLNDDRVRSRLVSGIEDGKETGYEYIRDIPAGSLAMTGKDAALFMQTLLRNDGKILRPETLREMFTQQNQTTASRDIAELKVGLGFFLELPGRIGGRAVVWHNGGIRSDYSLLIVLPDEDLGLAITASSDIAVDELAESILVKALELRTGQDIAELADMPDRLTADYRPEDLAGYYFAPILEGVWEITVKKNRLFAKTNDGTSLKLVPTPRGDLELKYRLFGIIPLPVEELKGISFSVRRNSQRQLGMLFNAEYPNVVAGLSRITAVAIPSAWMDLCGNYVIQNASKREIADWQKLGKSNIEIRFDKDSGFLLIDSLPIRPISDKHAIIMGEGRGLGETISRLPGGRLFVSGYILKGAGEQGRHQ